MEPTKAIEPAKAIEEQPKAVEPATTNVLQETKPASARFNADDSYCVIVASFATRSQAETYMAEHSGKQLGVIEKDSRFRVYAATGSSYEQANSQKKFIGNADAWVCRR